MGKKETKKEIKKEGKKEAKKETKKEAKKEAKKEIKKVSKKESKKEAKRKGTCWESETKKYPKCKGFESVGYKCAKGFCAACDPKGTPAKCAVAKKKEAKKE